MFEVCDKIFVVALVLAVIFAGLVVLLFYLDNRLRKAEKKLKELRRSYPVKDSE